MAQNVLGRLTENITATTNNPTSALDHRLFDEAELILPETITPADKSSLVASLSALLPTLQQDPTPAVNLLLKLVNDYSYGDVLKLGNVPFTDGLAVGDHMFAFNRLILVLLRKAALNAADAASVAGMLDTVLALVRLWLCTSDTGIATQAQNVLLDLLRVDQIITTPNAHVPSGGQGLIWKRLFSDRDVYRALFEACSLTGPSSFTLSKSQRTLAQARMMEWLPKVGALDWNAISKSHHAEIEAQYKVPPGGGLLDFASLYMVDTKDDVLLYRCLIDFYSDILHCTKPGVRVVGTPTESLGLTYLVAKGVHAKTSALYIQLPGAQLDPVETMFLYGPAANYIAAYASDYPEHFLASQMPAQVLQRLGSALSLSPARWAHAESPKHDLHLLASLPRRTLLGNSSPLFLLPSKATNPDVLNTLATIFHGPDRDVILQPGRTLEQDTTSQEEAAQARTLYFNYLAQNPRFWSDIATHADTVALKDLALAAIHCLTSVITANWSDASRSTLTTSIATPASGHLAILSPPALEHALPYLLKPPQTFANLVGGRGDPESSAYKIAAAKFDALQAFHSRLVGQVARSPGEGYEEILSTVHKRIAEGPLSREGEVGGRIATMDL